MNTYANIMLGKNEVTKWTDLPLPLWKRQDCEEDGEVRVFFRCFDVAQHDPLCHPEVAEGSKKH